jgi:hypothetical protein
MRESMHIPAPPQTLPVKQPHVRLEPHELGRSTQYRSGCGNVPLHGWRQNCVDAHLWRPHANEPASAFGTQHCMPQPPQVGHGCGQLFINEKTALVPLPHEHSQTPLARAHADTPPPVAFDPAAPPVAVPATPPPPPVPEPPPVCCTEPSPCFAIVSVSEEQPAKSTAKRRHARRGRRRQGTRSSPQIHPPPSPRLRAPPPRPRRPRAHHPQEAVQRRHRRHRPRPPLPALPPRCG